MRDHLADHGLLRGYPVNDRNDWLYEDPGPNPPCKAQGVRLAKRRRFPEIVFHGSQEVQKISDLVHASATATLWPPASMIFPSLITDYRGSSSQQT
jgi:hypothetical protein